MILSVLENSTSYTLTPGSAPVNTDIVEYFLFDSREGYCVHYASAATLMYRLYGIPARYEAGYAVQPSDFVLQEDGTWVAEVTDESAHAWTEIFLEDYGWTPVEVTPASDGSMLASYPGFDAAAAVLPQVRVDQPSERDARPSRQRVRPRRTGPLCWRCLPVPRSMCTAPWGEAEGSCLNM